MREPNTVTAGKVVTIHYELKLDSGRVVDSSAGRDPLAYLHGAANIVRGLETALEGAAVGADMTVVVVPKDGYGERMPDAIQRVPRRAFPADSELSEGMTFQARNEQGQPLMGTIAAIIGDDVTVDFNHPLAGERLHFTVSIEAVRDATAEERTHGHVHGPGGHHH